MANEQRAPATILDIDRVTMWTPSPGSQTERATLNWSIYNGQPRITVWTRVPDDKDKGMISAAMNPLSMEALLILLGKVAEGKPGIVGEVGCDGTKWDNTTNEKLEGRHHLASVVVGKNEEGVVWIQVVSSDESRPVIRFHFQNIDWHWFRHGDGTRFSESDMSVLMTKASINKLREVYSRHTDLVITAEEKQRRSDAAKSRRNGGGGGRGAPPAMKASTEDFADITF